MGAADAHVVSPSFSAWRKVLPLCDSSRYRLRVMDGITENLVAAQMPAIGDRIAGRYELVSVLGEGGMGVVYRAIQQPLGRSVAVKVLLGEFASDENKRARFLTEAKILANLKSASTVSLIDFGVLDDGLVFIAMEFLEGGTLRTLMDKGPIPPRICYSIVQQILKALTEAHSQNIIHRDLKPGNVLIDHIDGDRWVVRVADFGIAKWQHPDEVEQSGVNPLPDADVQVKLVQTAPGIRLGTPEYIPPEQAFAKSLDVTADLYALGVIFYEMLLGRKPFSAENAQGMYLAHLYEAPKPLLQVAPHLGIPQKVDDLILTLMQKQPQDRPQSAKSVLKMINRIIHEAPLAEQTFTEIPALNPVFAHSESTEESEIPTQRVGNGQTFILILIGVGLGVGVSALFL